MRGDSGQVTVMAVGLALVSFAVAGLAADGTRAWLYRRTLQNAADASALAAASEVDRNAYYSSGGRSLLLDAASARRVALQWLGRRGLRVRTTVTVDESGVTVGLRDEVPTAWLSLVGIRSVPVAVLARAEPVSGVADLPARTRAARARYQQPETRARAARARCQQPETRAGSARARCQQPET
jgi:hypothetical protein